MRNWPLDVRSSALPSRRQHHRDRKEQRTRLLRHVFAWARWAGTAFARQRRNKNAHLQHDTSSHLPLNAATLTIRARYFRNRGMTRCRATAAQPLLVARFRKPRLPPCAAAARRHTISASASQHRTTLNCNSSCCGLPSGSTVPGRCCKQGSSADLGFATYRSSGMVAVL